MLVVQFVVQKKLLPEKLFTDCFCKELRPGLNWLSDGTDRWRIPLQDEDNSGKNPHSVPGFPRLCSGMFPKRFRTVSVPTGSREIRLV